EAASVAVRRNHLAAIGAAQGLPDWQANRILDEPNMSIAEQRLNPAGMFAARGDVQRKPTPQRVCLVTVGEPPSAFGLAIVRHPAMVVEAVARSPVVPLATPRHLKAGRSRCDAH